MVLMGEKQEYYFWILEFSTFFGVTKNGVLYFLSFFGWLVDATKKKQSTPTFEYIKNKTNKNSYGLRSSVKFAIS